MSDSTVELPAGFINELAAATSREQVLAVSAKWMPRIIQSERSSLALPHDSANLQVYAMSGAMVIPQGSLLCMRESLVGQAFTSQRIVNCGDLESSPASEAPRLVDFGLRSAIVCPMVIGGRSLGTINLGSTTPDKFSPEEEVLLRTIVDFIASFMYAHDRADTERHRAMTDQLTQCLSRAAVLSQLESACDVSGHEPSVLYLDVDGFKAINDTHGHSWGDELLRVLVRRIGGVIGDRHHLGRLGGDEFLIVIDDDPDGDEARRCADAVEDACSMPVVFRAVQLTPRVSIGVAADTRPDADAEELLHDADQAMYHAKASTQQVAIADDRIRARATMIATIDRDLDIGMRTGEITYHYQPVRDITTREIMGAEALIRWSHPRLGPVPANLLVERLESTGRTEAFTRWSLQTIVGHWRELRDSAPWFAEKSVSINLSPRQLAWTGYTDFHLGVLRDYGFQPQDVIVEVVESSEIHPGDPAEITLRRLGESDVVIALDDFGTGHNALWYFTRFAIHAIKFDRSLVGIAHENANARTILSGLAAMSHELGVVSVGEGVETETEARVCQQLGITHGQGWHFGRPVPLATFAERAHEEGPRAVDSWPAVATESLPSTLG